MSLVFSPEIKDSSWCQCSSTFLNGRILNFCPFLLLFPAYKIHKCHSMRHCYCQNKCYIIPFQDYLFISCFFSLPLSEMKKECGMETQIIHGAHGNIHLLICPVKCWEAQNRNRQWPAYMTTELPPTGSAAVRPGSRAPCLQQHEQPGLSICQLPLLLLLLPTHNPSEKKQICLPN